MYHSNPDQMSEGNGYRYVLFLSTALGIVVLFGFVSPGVASAETQTLEVEITSPDEMFVDHENVVEVNLSSSRGIEETWIELHVESVSASSHPSELTRQGKLVSRAESGDGSLELQYEPEEMGPKNLYLYGEVEYVDGGGENFERKIRIPHDAVLEPRVWEGVAVPIPESVDGDVERVIREDWRFSDEYDLENETNLFWGPTTGDGRLYLLLTPKQVEYGPFRMVASLACYPDHIYYELTEDFLVCFYVANHLTFYDRPATVLPTNQALRHGETVVLDASYQKIRQRLYEYTGERTDREIVFVDHSNVLESSDGERILGVVLNVPFTRYFYEEQYNVSGYYVYPMEVLQPSEEPKLSGDPEIKSGLRDHVWMEKWENETASVRSPQNDSSSGRSIDTSDEDAPGSKPSSEAAVESSRRSKPHDQGLNLFHSFLALSIAFILTLNRER